MTDTVQVPREATKEMLVAGARANDDFRSKPGPYARTKAVWTAMLAAAPQATDPRDCPLGLDKTPTLCSAGTCHTCLSTRIATLAVERDAARATTSILEAVRAALIAAQQTLDEYQRWCGQPHAFVGQISLRKVRALIAKALTTQPSKTETRDEG